MKHLLTLALGTLILAPMAGGQAQGAQIAADYAAAANMPKKDGYLVFAYAQGWDKFSKSLCEKLMQDAAIRQAAGESVLLGMPVFQFAKQAQRDYVSEIVGPLGIREAESYPAILFFTPKHRHYATICGPEMMRAKPEELAPLIQSRIAAMHTQEDLLNKAEQASGIEKAKLLGQAARVEGASTPDWLTKEVQSLDPNDETGYVRSLTFNPFVFTEDFIYETQGITDPNKKKDEKAPLSVEATLERIDKLLADPAYTNEQKQTFCSNAIGAIHRLGDVTNNDKLRAYAQKMKELAPDTVLGRSADAVIKAWGSGLTYGKGWSKQCLPKDDTPIELQGELPIQRGGVYKVKFQWTGGKHPLRIKGVRLYNDKKLISEDMHDGVAGYGPSNQDNIYTITIRARLPKPHLYIIFDMATDRDTKGNIVIERE